MKVIGVDLTKHQHETSSSLVQQLDAFLYSVLLVMEISKNRSLTACLWRTYTLHDYRIDVPTLKGEHDWSGVDPVKCQQKISISMQTYMCFSYSVLLVVLKNSQYRSFEVGDRRRRFVWLLQIYALMRVKGSHMMPSFGSTKRSCQCKRSTRRHAYRTQ